MATEAQFLDDRIFQKGTLALISQSSEGQGSVPDPVYPTTGSDNRAPSALLQGRTARRGEVRAELSVTWKPVHLFTGCSSQTVADLNPQTRRASHGFQHGVGSALLFSSPDSAEGGLFCPREFLKVGEQGTGTDHV